MSETIYQNFCKALSLSPVESMLPVMEYSDISQLAASTQSERFTAALWALVDCMAGSEVSIEHVSKEILDYFIARIDQVLSAQLDEILHHPDFQALESIWRGLDYLVKRVDFRSNIKVELLNVSQEALQADFEDAPDMIHSGLYKHVYSQEYDTPGGEPITAMISNYTFDAGDRDVRFLRAVSKVAAATHCPFIGAVDGRFFEKKDFAEVAAIPELSAYMERAEYVRWNSFRESEDARYIGLTCPRFLLRMPYGIDNPVRGFCYSEMVSDDAEKYLWGCSSFAFAANIAKSFKEHGWAVNIRGPEAGGKVEQLPLPQYDVGRGLIHKIPTEAIIPETRELELANLGFIPLSYYKNSDYACFFSANSAQKPAIYLSKEATANSRINARLPYIFLSARIAHYLKVLQREAIGSHVSREQLEDRLNTWLQSLVTKMRNPEAEQVATHPLRDGKVEVQEIEDNPGFYRVVLFVMPHFQIEGIDVSLSVVGKMPTDKTA